MLNTQQRQELKNTMESEASSLRRTIEGLEDQTKSIESDCGVPGMIPSDLMDCISTNELALSNARQRLAKLQDRLRHLDDPGFDSCVQCGDSIPEGRIMAAPESGLCVRCAKSSSKYYV